MANTASRETAKSRAEHPSLSDVADQELEWFFTMAECDMGAGSIEEQRERDRPDAAENRAEAARAYAKIRTWLVEMTDREAGVLKAGYVARPWPLALREELGRLTGVVVRLASAEIGWPDDTAAQEELEARVATRLDGVLAKEGSGGGVLARFQPRAEALFRDATKSYLRERGRGPSAVKKVV